MSERLLGYLVLSFIGITALIAAAALFVPGAAAASTIVGIIVGGYVSILTGIPVGAAVTRKLRQATSDDNPTDKEG